MDLSLNWSFGHWRYSWEMYVPYLIFQGALRVAPQGCCEPVSCICWAGGRYWVTRRGRDEGARIAPQRSCTHPQGSLGSGKLYSFLECFVLSSALCKCFHTLLYSYPIIIFKNYIISGLLNFLQWHYQSILVTIDSKIILWYSAIPTDILINLFGKLTSG